MSTYQEFDYSVVDKQDDDTKSAPKIHLRDKLMALDKENARDLIVVECVKAKIDISLVVVTIRPFC